MVTTDREMFLQPSSPGYTPHFMLVPSLACPAECTYCFGPHRGPVMSPETLNASLDFMGSIVAETGQERVKVTFHGGEPLVAGFELWQQGLVGIADRFANKQPELSLQSNLWLLDDEFCVLFREHRVDVGTSLDGPEEITDVQRGSGYFAQTMAGIRLAESHGIPVGCIATFTHVTIPRWREVFDFFLSERLGFSIHPAVPPIKGSADYALSPAQYGKLLCDLLDCYVDHRRELSISSLDQMCQGIFIGEGKVCTFRNCLGMFLAIDPRGDIYACQRFAGQSEYRLGRVADKPGLEHLLASPVAGRFAQREAEINAECRDCGHAAYCRGGCPYNAWARGNRSLRDPYCEAYREVLDHIRDRVSTEMVTEENIDAVAAKPWDGQSHPLLKKGPLIELAREGRHPSHIARDAKRIVAAVELSRGPDLAGVAARLVAMGICRTQESALASLEGLQESLHPETRTLNNLYLHVTFRCQLECTHCYARSDARGHQQPDMPVSAIVELVREAKEVGFRQVVFTGGEPLVHTHRGELLNALREARSWTRPVNLVLRTNLAMSLNDETLAAISSAFDQVVASIDGDAESHDARRGEGAYDAAIANLEQYQIIAGDVPNAGELSLACVMRSSEICGEQGDAVRTLATRLGVQRTRFRPLLPIGRAGGWDDPPTSEALGGHADPMELIEGGFHPVATCGIGQNLYVEPSGESFPCYAYHRPHSYLGNVITNGLDSILNSSDFRGLPEHTVDSNAKCVLCELRYLCGGACRAWGGQSTQRDLDAIPLECDGMKKRAEQLLAAAKNYLGLCAEEGSCLRG